MCLQRSTFLGLISTLVVLPVLGQSPAAAPQGGKPTKPAVTSPAKSAVTSTAVAKTGSGPATTPKRTAPSTVQKTKVGSKTAKGKKVPQPQAQLPPPPPPPPPTPAQSPPNPARVTMRNGLLTIEANNSTLADVLSGVRRETKAAIDLPAGASGERVVASLGPGTPQSVLTSLLNGSRFDYIILGSEDQPDAVQRVILRAKSGPEPAPGGPALTAQRAPNPGGAVAQPVEPDDNTDEQGAPADQSPDESNPQAQQEIDNEQQQGQQQPQQGVKTPEQLLEELRQMQQQQQQNQDQQQQQQQPQIYQQPQPQPQQPQPDEQ